MIDLIIPVVRGVSRSSPGDGPRRTPTPQRSQGRTAFLLAALAAFAVHPALDATTLTTTATAGLADGWLVVDLAIANDGDTAARAVAATLRFADQTAAAPVEPQLAPGESFESTLRLLPAQITPGRWPYRVEIAYRDSNERAAHGLHVGHFIVGSVPDDEVEIETPTSVALTDRGAVEVRMRNSSSSGHLVRLEVLAPASLRSLSPTVLDLAAGAQETVRLRVENVSAPVASRLALFVIASYTDGGVEHSLITPLAAEIVAAQTPPATSARAWWLTAAGLWILWAAGVLLRRRQRAASLVADSAAASSLLESLCDGGAVLAAMAFVGSHFPPGLLFAATTTNGGDMASHVYTAVYLHDVLLPRGQLLGWCPGNLAGFPFLQFYFPLPFLVMAAMATVMPLLVAFKLVTVAGPILLPLFCYAGLRLLGSPFPGPALASVASLLFLFMEDNSMWGGNIPSTLAGEFSFSLGFGLAILFVGTLSHSARTGRGVAGNGILEALIGLAHGYALLWAGLVSLLELVAIDRWWRRLGILMRVHGLAILLMAFWLFPLLWYSPWTTAYSSVWRIDSWREIVPPILWPAAIVAVATTLVHVVVCWQRRTLVSRVLGTLWGAVALSLFFYKTAHSFHVVDIRFLPFLQIALCLLAAAGIAELASKLPARALWPLLALAVVPPWVTSSITYIPGWIQWNYSGFEAKPSWPLFADINDYLAGDFREPRVAWEHSPAHESLGTVRAFENLPLFSGRSTLEGVYMQANAAAPFVFYLQSEISKVTSCPFPRWGCASLDLARGIEHLEMFNASQLVLRSPEAKQAAAREPGLRRQAVFDDYEIHELVRGTGGYAEHLDVAPLLVRDPSWKEAAYRWFKYAAASDPVPVFAAAIDDADADLFAAVYDELPVAPAIVRLDEAPAIEVELDIDRIVLRGARPGHPVLVRVAYHPRWRAVTGERVWLAGPSFMLVFPHGEEVEFEFGTGPVLGTGRFASMLGLALVVLAFVPAARRRARSAAAALVPPPARAVVARAARRPAVWRWRLVWGSVAASMAALALAAATLHRADADSLYRRAQALSRQGELEAAASLYRRASEQSPLAMTAIHARYFEAIAYYKLERWQEAEERFRSLVAEFPEAPNVPEDLWHIGLCRRRLGDEEGAQRVWRDLVAAHPATEWAGYARRELPDGGNRTQDSPHAPPAEAGVD